MKRSSFRHYGLNQAKRYNLSVKSFGGVDYSTQKFLVADGHAIDAKNFVYRDGVVQKRHGWEQLIEVPTFEYIPSDFAHPEQKGIEEKHTNQNNKTINGIWCFEAEDGNKHVIAHIGKLMYEIKNIDNVHITAEPMVNGQASVGGETRNLVYEFEDFKSFAFVGGKKLWFLGGNKYMYLRFYRLNNTNVRVFEQVEDSSIVPIPTTTVSITYTNSIVNQRNSLDAVNLLTRWRKNELISGTTKKEDEKTKTTYYEYTLDAPLITKSGEDDLANISITINERGEM